MIDELNKNILDLEFQKQLIVTSTTMVICFTYFVGLFFAIASSQINLNSIITKIGVTVISIGLLGFSVIILFRSILKIKNIPEEIKSLNKGGNY